MEKARSRLTTNKQSSKRTKPHSKPSKFTRDKLAQAVANMPKLSWNSSSLVARLLSNVHTYREYWRALAISLLFAAIVLGILTQVAPSRIRDVILPNSYLPLLVPTFLSLFFGCSFVLLNTRRGLLVSSFLTALLFLRLQRVLITTELVIVLLTFFGILEILSLVYANILKRSRSK